MSTDNYSTRVGAAGPQAIIPPEVLVRLGVTEGDFVDFDFVNGAWQISGRHQVSIDYFPPQIGEILSKRLRSIKAGSYIEISDMSAERKAFRAKAARNRTD